MPTGGANQDLLLDRDRDVVARGKFQPCSDDPGKRKETIRVGAAVIDNWVCHLTNVTPNP